MMAAGLIFTGVVLAIWGAIIVFQAINKSP
jgi:hypothetical protein